MTRLLPLIFALASFSFQSTLAGANQHEGVLSPNLAEKGALVALEHVDEALADAIIAARPLGNSIDLSAVLAASLEQEQVTAVLVELFVPINLNSATRDEIMLVPGMSRRMAHEFEEYRPYTDIDQLRREIGKYVDDDEVARFEQYVTLD